MQPTVDRRWSALALSGLIAAVAACGGGSASPSPTQAPSAAAPSAPASEAAGTDAPSASAAAAFPKDGQAITMIVPYGVGGGSDITGRLVATEMEKTLGVPVPVVNKAGASGQIGLTEFLSTAKPDGYTVAWANSPITSGIYLNPNNKATFGREDFTPVANAVFDPIGLFVSANSPYQSLQDLVDAAKANPGAITISSSAILSPGDMAIRALAKATGAEFTTIYFEDAGPQRAALLGDQVNVEVNSISEVAGAVEGGQVRALTVFDDQASPFLPGVKTAKDEGFDITFGSSRALMVPAGTQQEVVDVLTAAVEKAITDATADGRLDELYLSPRFMDGPTFATYWEGIDTQVGELINEVLASS